MRIFGDRVQPNRGICIYAIFVSNSPNCLFDALTLSFYAHDILNLGEASL